MSRSTVLSCASDGASATNSSNVRPEMYSISIAGPTGVSSSNPKTLTTQGCDKSLHSSYSRFNSETDMALFSTAALRATYLAPCLAFRIRNTRPALNVSKITIPSPPCSRVPVTSAEPECIFISLDCNCPIIFPKWSGHGPYP